MIKEEITLEDAKKMLEKSNYYNTLMNHGVIIDTIVNLLINKKIFTEDEYNKKKKEIKDLYDENLDKLLQKEVEQYNKNMQDPKKVRIYIKKYIRNKIERSKAMQIPREIESHIKKVIKNYKLLKESSFIVREFFNEIGMTDKFTIENLENILKENNKFNSDPKFLQMNIYDLIKEDDHG